MNDQERWDLEWIKQRHAELQREMSELAGRMKLLETKQDKGQSVTPATLLPPRIVIKLTDASQPEPPPLPSALSGSVQPLAQSEEPKIIRCLCQHCGGQIEFPAVLVGESRPCPLCGQATFLVMEARPTIVPPPIRSPIPPGTPPGPPPVAPPIDPALAPGAPQSPAQPTAPRLKLQVEPDRAKFLKCLCVSCGEHIEFPASAGGDTILCPHCNCSTRLSTDVESPPVPPRIVARAVPASPPSKPSFEMRLGTYWFVRIGIVMVLTGLVFFGAYTYENYIGLLGPAGKVSLLYAASTVLLGFGAWWQRKAAKESLKNYAQVLFAGGLAAVYFTTYAAHHIQQLCIIDSALLDGALLLAWAGFMAWIADRKKSEVLALFAVGLAYYTSVITRVGSFTLYSNFVLTLAAVFFLVRNRWAVLSLASLVATYAAYGFWRFFDGSSWHWASPEAGLWTGAGFLMSYWLSFTAAVFLSKHEKFTGPNRAGFLTLNNGAFYTMFLLTMLQVHHGGFWKFSLGYGVVLLGLAALARWTLAAEPLTKNSYLTQGLLLATVGLITKFAGLKLALLLGTESVMLLTLGILRQSLILQIGAYLSGALAVGWGIASLVRDDLHGLYLGVALGALMTFNGFWSHRRSAAEDDEYPIRPVPTYFTILALASWLATTWYNTTPSNFPLALAVEALALTFSIYLLRLREMVLLGQGFLLLGQFAWLLHFILPSASPPWWNPALMIAVTVGLSHWWQRQKVLKTDSRAPLFWRGFYALALMGVLYFWLNPLVDAPAWLMLTSLLAVGITAYGVFTRLWFLAALGQIFLLVSGVQFVWQLLQAKPQWHFPLAPIVALSLLSFGTVRWFQRKPDVSEQIRTPLLQIALLYRWVAMVMSIWWVCDYIPARERIWLLGLLGLLMFLWNGLYPSRETMLFSAAFTLTALALFWLPLLETTTVYWPNLVVIVILLGQRQMAKRLPEYYDLDFRVHATAIIVGGLSLWLFLTRWVCQNASGFYLTASWSALALALFTVGMTLRERVYRWLGLSVLAFALGRIVIFDVWKLETLYRILSFMALGIVLLVLGFIYNKYQEKIKEWL